MSSTPRSLLTLKRSAAADSSVAIDERLHKVLANAGLGSRRMLEQRIQAGEIIVNGQPAQTGSSVRAGDRVEVDRKQFIVATDSREHAEVLMYHKPEGELTTRDDPEGRPTVFENLPHLNGSRWISVGRLDVNTTGLLLLTTDGELANSLMHPRNEIEREYLCRVHGEVPDETLEKLQAGVDLEDGPARFDRIHVVSRGGSHCWFRVILHEGRNREVRLLWDSQGFLVSRLKRIRYGNVELPRSLRPGQHESMSEDAIKQLRELAGSDTAQPALTLKPVLHQRHTPRGVREVRPDNQTPNAWTGIRHDEARELTAFDRVRPDDFNNRGKRRRGPPRGDVNGNVLRPDKPAGGPRRNRRGVAPGQELPSVRTWFAGDKRPGSKGPGGRGPGGKRPAGRGASGNGPGARGPGGNRSAGRGPAGNGPGGRGPGGPKRGPGGPRGNRGPGRGG
ncbi:MAG TPA: pseudouridine synthase [Rhodanobacteraceae bacterium]|jgi:23S rRNA pseudouridine2605 synthase|nr:pseudouridine synthase [Rhodanobacteraceae bacterium]